jgi:manganese efflux pump family protein
MSPIAITLLALSMSADAFAASIARGATTRPNFAGAVRGGLVFGIVEAITPILGWAVGIAASGFVGAIDHWIAFAILGAVGARMIWEALTRDEAEEEEEEAEAAPPRSLRGMLTLVLLAVGTSIDAAAVGVTLALVGENILTIAAAIGLATFVMTTIGLSIGRMAGAKLGSAVEVIGGVVLIGIGTVILLEHLGVLG